MKKLFSILFIILFAQLGWTNDLPSRANTESIKPSEITLVTVDKNNPSKIQVIPELLALQKSLLISLKNPIPEEFLKTGFLLVPMTTEYVSHLLEEKEGIFILAYLEQNLVGYILLTNTSNFTELYQDGSAGFLETSINFVKLQSWLNNSAVGYIEQIGVKPSYSRMGIGSQLIAKSKELKPLGLVADVFIYPVKNEASLRFFAHQGFTPSAILHQHPATNANFPYAHRTQVYFWNL
jgi:ribosomal protein S18 acetylase RimI-like enzyme